MKGKISDEDSQKMIDGIYDSGWRLHNFLKSVLDGAKISEGIIEIKEEPTQLSELVNGIMQLFLPAALQKSIKLTGYVSKTIPEIVNIDKLRVERILMNLVDNAIKFTSQGKVSISVKFYHKAAKQWVKISVKDTGIGISEENQKVLFERFSRLTTCFETNDLSPGLGLWISKTFAEELGGTITLKSEEGQGAEFIFTFPLS